MISLVDRRNIRTNNLSIFILRIFAFGDRRTRYLRPPTPNNWSKIGRTTRGGGVCDFFEDRGSSSKIGFFKSSGSEDEGHAVFHFVVPKERQQLLVLYFCFGPQLDQWQLVPELWIFRPIFHLEDRFGERWLSTHADVST